jgi:hypothetical protein
MIELTDIQRRELEGAGPALARDPETNETYVLIRAALYERLKALLYDDSEFPLNEAYPLVDEMAAKAGWDDPAMDVYDDFAPKEGNER